MEELHPEDFERNSIVGYKEIWCSRPEMLRNGLKTTEDKIKSAILYTSTFGISLGKSNYGATIIMPTKNHAYLYCGCFIVYHELELDKEKVECYGIISSSTTHLMTIIGRTKGKVLNAAKKLKLPLEELVKQA